MKNADPLMDAKLNCRHISKSRFSFFLAVSARFWRQSLQKVLIWPKNMFHNKSIWVSENGEFDADFEFAHFYVNIFFCSSFLDLFIGFEMGVKFLRF